MNCCLSSSHLLPVHIPLLSLYLISQTWWDFNIHLKMVFGMENGLALVAENEGGNGVVTSELVDDGRKPPKSNSKSKSKVRS